MASADLVKFNINPDPNPAFGFMTQAVYDACHNAYHSGLAALTAKPAAEENKSLQAKINAERTLWRNEVDLTADDHEALTEVQSMTEVSVYGDEGDVRRLEALYNVLNTWTAKVKGQLDYELSKAVNPNATTGPNVTKDELKALREFAQNAIVTMNAAMSMAMGPAGPSPITIKSWEELPKGRSAAPKVSDGGKFIGSRYMFRVNDAPDDCLVNPSGLIEFLSDSGEKWTTAKLQDFVDENDCTWGKEWSLVIGGHKVEALFVR